MFVLYLSMLWEIVLFSDIYLLCVSNHHPAAVASRSFLAYLISLLVEVIFRVFLFFFFSSAEL